MILNRTLLKIATKRDVITIISYSKCVIKLSFALTLVIYFSRSQMHMTGLINDIVINRSSCDGFAHMFDISYSMFAVKLPKTLC